MTMSKAKLREWPWNNQPSKRHVWGKATYSKPTQNWSGYVGHYDRCGCSFVERADTRAPVYCYATPAWLAAHPNDDGKEG
jgi:hypothetical protein